MLRFFDILNSPDKSNQDKNHARAQLKKIYYEPDIDLTLQLMQQGYSIEYNCINPGGLTTQSSWKATIIKNGQRFTCDYFKGSAHRYINGKRIPQNLKNTFSHYDDSKPIPPCLAEVLYTLSMDASFVMHGQFFEDFCEDLGYDSDSIKAFECFEGCTDNWRGLVRIGANLEQLQEMFQDY